MTRNTNWDLAEQGELDFGILNSYEFENYTLETLRDSVNDYNVVFFAKYALTESARTLLEALRGSELRNDTLDVLSHLAEAEQTIIECRETINRQTGVVR